MKKYKYIALVAAAVALSIVAVKLYADGHKAEEKYTRCAAVRMKEINIGHLEKNLDKSTTLVPKGWTVVSGTGGDGHPKLLICQ